MKWMGGLYKKNVWLGVGATIGGFLAFTPFMCFLFLKTIWDFRKSDMVGKGESGKKNRTVDAEIIEETSDDVIMDKLNWLEDKLPFSEPEKETLYKEPEERRPNSHLPQPPDLQ